MADETRDDGLPRGVGGVEGEGQTGASCAPEDGGGRDPDPRLADEEEPEERLPPITLDRYMSRRRGRSAVSWPHVGALVIMLAILVALVMFKDRCGQAVSGMIFMLSPDAGTPPAKARIEMERPASRPRRTPASAPSK